jgi:hypothetical protein
VAQMSFLEAFFQKKFFSKKIISRGNFVRGIDCAHRKILKKFFRGQKSEKNASKLGIVSFNPNKIIFGGF